MVLLGLNFKFGLRLVNGIGLNFVFFFFVLFFCFVFLFLFWGLFFV